ncbi:hypothetical protein ACFQY4_40805 [Catellatospora bangladeshensis]|uniref:hypothetical protein n=1 Tax=Catellatospora bangladeshensis TaxID=310355 RepID=UPI0036141C1D
MIVYYRDPAVEVTSTAIHIHDRVFRLDDLEYVWHREITADPGRCAASPGAAR